MACAGTTCESDADRLYAGGAFPLGFDVLKICVVTSHERATGVCPEPYPFGTALAEFLERRGHEATLLFTGPNDAASQAFLEEERKRGRRIVELARAMPASASTFYPEFLKASWLTYQWLKRQSFDAIIFQDDTGVGLLSLEAKTLREAFAATHLGYHLHGPPQWTSHLREPRQLLNPDLILDHAVQYGVEHADRLVVPASYFLERIRASGWRATERVTVLPALPAGGGAESGGTAQGRPRHLCFPVHPTDRSSFSTFLQALSGLQGQLGQEGVFEQLRVSFVCHGSPKDRRLFAKRAEQYLQTYLPGLARDFLEARSTVPGDATSRLWLFSPPWMNLPGPALETAARGEFLLLARNPESETIAGLESTLVGWNVADLTGRLREILVGRNLPRAMGFNRTALEKNWDHYLHEIESDRAHAMPDRDGKELRVTIGVAHFNKGAYLDETLETLRAQTHPNVEVIVVDDASNDPDSLRAFREAAARHASSDWLFIHRSENLGPGHARNLTASRATGSHLIFFDADDLAHPDMVERLVRAVVQPGVDCVGGSSRRFRQAGDRREFMETSTYAGGSLEAALLHPPAGAVFIISRENFQRVGGFKADFPQESHEDWNFHVRLLAAGMKLHVLPEPVFSYRSVEQSRSAVVTRNMARNLEPFLQSTPQVRERLLLLALNRAWVADHAVKALQELDHLSRGIRFLRFLGRTRRSIQRRLAWLKRRSGG
jgi:GT2 family glycosyltransferase